MSKRTTGNVIEGEVVYTIPEFDPFDALGRLLLGISLEGVEQFFTRLKVMEKELFDSADFANVTVDETVIDQLRYLFVGALFLSQQRIRRRVGQTLRVASAVSGVIRPLVRRVSENWFVRQGWGLVSADVERLVGEGRLQERNARRVARNLLGVSIDEVIGYLQDSQSLESLLEQSIATNKLGSKSSEQLEQMLDNLASVILEKFSERRTEEAATRQTKRDSKTIHPDDHL